MLKRLQYVSTRRLAQPIRALPTITRGAKTTTKLPIPAADLTTPTAEKLAALGIYNPATKRRRSASTSISTASTKAKRKTGPGQLIDPGRVNIVSEKLCQDVIQRLGPSLERHRGCDLIDLNPGCGLWSKTLHDAVQPQKHIMMDPDANAYEPFLREIMQDRPNIEVIPKSGIIWADLHEMLSAKLDPKRHPIVGEEGSQARNNTLLVTANISTFPKKEIYSFDSLATLVLYQFISSLRTSSLFQRYGLVRMLLWVNDENKRRIIPRSMVLRKRAAFEAELFCEYIHEVAGYDDPDLTADRLHLRDEWQNIESAANTLQRMEQNGIITPPGRETRMLRSVSEDRSLLGQKLAGVRPPMMIRPFRAELAELEGQSTDFGSDDWNRRRLLRWRDAFDDANAGHFLELLNLKERACQMDPTSAEFAEADAAFNTRIDGFRKNQRNEFFLIMDSQHLFRHQPSGRPALFWDKREYEPLAIDPTEFLPNAPSTLLDIQPKPTDPLLKQSGPQSSRSGDISEALLRGFYTSTTAPVTPRAMDLLWPGFTDFAKDQCPSLRDVKLGGSPMSGYGTLHVRSANEHHWIEILNAWMKWPFKPTYPQLVGRVGVDNGLGWAVDDDGEASAAQGAGIMF